MNNKIAVFVNRNCTVSLPLSRKRLMSNKTTKKKRTKKITVFVNRNGMASLQEDFDPYVPICQDVLDKFGIMKDREKLQADVVTKIVLSVESVVHGETFNWTAWEKLRVKHD